MESTCQLQKCNVAKNGWIIELTVQTTKTTSLLKKGGVVYTSIMLCTNSFPSENQYNVVTHPLAFSDSLLDILAP